MKTARTHLSLALMFTLTLVLFMSVYPAAAQNKRTISTKQLKVLLKTASEPADHQKIADYYRQEAARLTQDARQHADLAKLYTENPPYPGMVSKHGTDFGQGAPHCQRWAELDAEQAKEAEALATLHDNMAKAAAQKQQ